MELDIWLCTNKMTITELASLLDCDRHYLNRIVNKHLKPGKRLARDIVLATKGQVTEKELMNIDSKEVTE